MGPELGKKKENLSNKIQRSVEEFAEDEHKQSG